MIALKDLYYQVQQNLFTDLTLDLVDSNETITVNVHRCILYASKSNYFKKLLIGFNEENKKNISIEVNNAPVAYDTIMTFYGKEWLNSGKLPHWKYVLEMILCRDFFGLEIEKNLIEDIAVPNFFQDSEGFLLLLQVIESIIGFDKKSISTIYQNIPKDISNEKIFEIFDLLPTNVLNEILKNYEGYDIITYANNGELSRWRLQLRNDNKIVIESTQKSTPGMDLCFSHDGKLIAQICPGQIKIINANTLNTIQMIDANYIKCICFVPVYHHILYTKYHFNTNISDFVIIDLDGKFIKNIPFTIQCNRIACSPDGTKFVSCHHNFIIRLYDISTGKIIGSFYNEELIISICFSPDSKTIAFATERCIKIINESMNIIDSIQPEGHVRCINFLPSGKELIICLYGGYLEIHNLESKQWITKKLSIINSSINKIHVMAVNDHIVDNINKYLLTNK